MTPEECWSGVKPDITNLCVFSCPAYVLIPKELHMGKLAHKTHQCIFLGYSLTCKAWHFWNPMKCSVIKSRDVVFDECVQCCDHLVPLVDLSSLECAEGTDDPIPPADASPVTNSDVATSHPMVDPHIAAPPMVPLPLLVPMPTTPLPPPMLPCTCGHRLNEVEHLFDFFEHHPLLLRSRGSIVTKPTPYSNSTHFSDHFAYHIAFPFVIT